jgi:hypothetical protein
MTLRLTKTEKLISALATGKNQTSEQLARKSGLQNVSSTIDRLRVEGFKIYSNLKGKKGSKQHYYRMP